MPTPSLVTLKLYKGFWFLILFFGLFVLHCTLLYLLNVHTDLILKKIYMSFTVVFTSILPHVFKILWWFEHLFCFFFYFTVNLYVWLGILLWCCNYSDGIALFLGLSFEIAFFRMKFILLCFISCLNCCVYIHAFSWVSIFLMFLPSIFFFLNRNCQMLVFPNVNRKMLIP